MGVIGGVYCCMLMSTNVGLCCPWALVVVQRSMREWASMCFGELLSASQKCFWDNAMVGWLRLGCERVACADSVHKW